jgi:hypothetical protein
MFVIFTNDKQAHVSSSLKSTFWFATKARAVKEPEAASAGFGIQIRWFFQTRQFQPVAAQFHAYPISDIRHVDFSIMNHC